MNIRRRAELDVPKCPNTVFINTSADVRLDNVHIYFGKGYVVRAWHTNGFAFVRSSLAESGIIGLYVGHFKFGPSKNIVIADSVIARSRTNGIALVGAYATDAADPVLVIDNVLNANHWHGLWPVRGVKGGIAAGGQLLVADGADIRINGNIEADAICEKCKPARTATAIEIADQAAPPGGVRGLTIDHNWLLNGVGVAIYQNPGMMASGIAVDHNRLVGFRYLDGIKTPASRQDNMLEQRGSTHAGAGAASYEVLRLAAAGEHHSSVSISEYPGAKLEAVFALSPSPRPGAPWTPLFRCIANGHDFVSPEKDCGGAGQLDALLGYSLAATDPGAKPFFACAASATDRILSWDATCEHKKRVGQLGYAIPAATPETIPASIAAPSPGAHP